VAWSTAQLGLTKKAATDAIASKRGKAESKL
jgi:hypothetical protein